MSKSKNTIVIGPSIGFSSILFFIFLILKLCNVIDWSWWFVTAPLWLPLALGISVLLLIMIVLFIIGIVIAIFGE